MEEEISCLGFPESNMTVLVTAVHKNITKRIQSENFFDTVLAKKGMLLSARRWPFIQEK